MIFTYGTYIGKYNSSSNSSIIPTKGANPSQWYIGPHVLHQYQIMHTCVKNEAILTPSSTSMLDTDSAGSS